MQTLKLVIGSKKLSSWSLRPWLLLKQIGLALRGGPIPLRQPDTAAADRRTRRAARCRCCVLGDIAVWDSLAIAEFLAERDPSCGPPIRPRAPWRARLPRRCTAASPPCGPSCRWTSPPASARPASCSPRSSGHRAGGRDLDRVPARYGRGGAVPVRRVQHRRRHVRAGLLALHDLRGAARPGRERVCRAGDGLAGDAGMGAASRRRGLGRAAAEAGTAARRCEPPAPRAPPERGRSRSAGRAPAPATAPPQPLPRRGAPAWTRPVARTLAGARCRATFAPPAWCSPTRRPRRRADAARAPQPAIAGAAHCRRAPSPQDAPRSRHPSRAGSAADPVHRHGQAHRGRNSSTTLR